MTKTLVIVESPAKARTLSKFLGKECLVASSMGHIKDLPKTKLGVDVSKDFQPCYQIIPKKAKVLKELKKSAGKIKKIYLASDPDREGEAISWHLYNELKKTTNDIKRVVFREITKDAINEALVHPREIDLRLVNAQQARRILDRIVGYKISPLLWKKVRRGLSAGRVQSVALRLICEREKEITSFQPVEYWSIGAECRSRGGENFEADLAKVGGKKVEIPDTLRAQEISSQLAKEEFVVAKIAGRKKERVPSPPFITATLQQKAAQKFHFRAQKTMSIAQELYEGLDIGKGEMMGLITYMRTDSFRIASSAVQEAKKYIEETFGPEYLCLQTRTYRQRKGAQEAHEAIRPTSLFRTPERLKKHLNSDQYRLYELIWNRFLASQMKGAIIEGRSVQIKAGRFGLTCSDSQVAFKGFLILYPEDQAFKAKLLPALKEKEVLKLLEVLPRQHFTQPPPRFSEASLIKTLEEKGIGRPSTYASIMGIIRSRDYVESQKGNFYPTSLGELVIGLLVKSFPDILNTQFTSQLESRLDKIEIGGEDWINLLHSFYEPFSADLERAQGEMKDVKSKLEEKTDKICQKCGSVLVIKHGRFGKFLSCSNFPKCKNAQSLTLGIKCPRELCGGEIIQRRTKKKRIFYGCNNYPKCDFSSWDKPIGRNCPDCNSFLVEKYGKGQERYIKCSNKECSYSEQIR
jgi:DNA topoisomerase-1